jgi:hypothetical protein
MFPPMHPSRAHRRRLALVAATAAGSLLATGLVLQNGTAQAQPERPAGPVDPVVKHRVTLVTGDVVTVTTLADYPLELSRLERGAVPSEVGESDAPTDLDRQILSLMLAGLTDQAVATQLDLSLRTVQRRLRHLQDLAGVKSRMQLGWYAGRHSWA